MSIELVLWSMLGTYLTVGLILGLAAVWSLIRAQR